MAGGTSPYGVGSESTVRGASTSRGALTMESGATSASFPLLTIGMPHLVIWAQQTAPVVAGQSVLVGVQFSVRPLGIGPSASGALDEWLVMPLPGGATSFALDPVGTPVLINLLFPASKIRISATIDAAFGVSGGIEYVLACTA